MRRFFSSKFGSSASACTLGAVFNAALSFGALTVSTPLLTPTDYGVLGLLTATAAVLGTLVGFNPHLFLIAKYHGMSRAKIARCLPASLPPIVIGALLGLQLSPLVS